jgi:hypothetical protein
MANYTLTYSESAQGWPSFYSFIPDYMIGMNNYFYTFKGGNLFRHNVNEARNNFYGTNYPSRIQSVFNTSPLENKIFKTINLEGNQSWATLAETDIQTSGFIESAWYEKKEASFFAFIRNAGTVPAQPSEYALRSVNGIGLSQNVTGAASALEVSFPISPDLTEIGSIVSVGDYLYYSLPPSYSTPVLCGQITSIVVDYLTGNNKIVVDTSIAGGSVPGITTPFFMYIKGSVAESHGVLGHYCVFTLENNSTTKVELFAVESEVMKSYP